MAIGEVHTAGERYDKLHYFIYKILVCLITAFLCLCPKKKPECAHEEEASSTAPSIIPQATH